MAKTIRIGGIDVEVPDDSPLASGAEIYAPAQLQADKPEEPEKLETLPYVYRPNDPFQSSVDRVVALRNIQEAKSWVRKAFLWMFLIIPMSIAEIRAIDALVSMPEGQKLKQFLTYNAIGLVACAPYLFIWGATTLHKKKKAASQAAR
jgi:hypothetical protein